MATISSFPGDPTKHPSGADRDWRCESCGKRLGIVRANRLHIQFARGPDYFVSLPAVAKCRGCGSLNELVAIGAAR